MRKLTLFFTTLFLSVGMAWAQTNANGPLVTFTNVQVDGTEYVLYINNDGVLDFSTTSAAELGEAAQFRATKQSNGKWTFYNESKGYYMIWRGNTSGGYNSNAGTLGEYNSTYCDWAVKTGSKDGLFRIVSKRSDVTKDGSIVIMRSGRFDAYGDDNGFVGTGNAHSNQFRIDAVDVVNHFGFEAAKDYASINKWYYLTFRPDWDRKLYYDGTSNVLDATKTTIDAKDKDAYSWAFIGNPVVGYKVVNKKAGEGKYLNAADGGAIVGTAEHVFTLTESSHATNGFFMAGNGKDRFNLQGGKVVYWSGADVGSTFVVTLRDAAAELRALIDNANLLLTNYNSTVGYVTADSKSAIETAISNAETAINIQSGYEQAEAAIWNAIANINTIQPETDKYYMIVSKHDGYAAGRMMAVDANSNGLIWNSDNNVSKWFKFVDAGEGKFYLYNVKSGRYMSTANASANNQQFAHATTTAEAKKITITNMGNSNIVKLVPDGGAMIHAQNTGNVVCWNNDAYTGASAWAIVEVENPGVAYIDNTNYATLAEAVAAWQEGKTINLLANTNETVVLPKGMKLDVINFNGFTANVSEFVPVAKVGEAEYASLAAAIKAASAGATITFVDNVKESVTLSKNVTIDGNGKQYTGTMTVNKGLTVTVENVNFVNGGIDKPKAQKSDTGTYTIKNCTFVDEGKYPYSLRFYGAKTLNVENCTVKNYLYSFLYINGSTQNLNINNVTVEDCPNYAVYFATGVNNATIEGLTVKNSNNGILVNNAAARTLTIKDCKMENVTTAINHANGTSAITANVQGQNNFGTAVLSQYAKCVLAEDATLAATTAGLNVTTNIEGKEVAYQGGKYSVVVKRAPAGQVAYRADVTDKTDREGIAILLKDPYAKNSLVVKVYNGETLMFTCTRRDIDDEGKVMFPVTANTTANIVLWGKPSGSWNNEIHVAPTELNVPDRVEIWADDVLVQNYTHESGTILGTNLEKYLALDCVKKFDAKIGNVGYETLAAAIENAQAGETIVLLRDVTASDIITINKAIALDGNGKTLTSTAARAFNIETEGKVVISNLTVNAAARAFNIINKAATVELNDVTATASNNAVMIATSAGAANVTINGCDFTGLAVVNVAGAGAQVEINNTNITNVDKNVDENYGAITVYSTATNAKVTVNGGSITVADDSKQAYIFAEGATVTGVDQIGQIVAMIGDAGYETLTEAIADAKEGQTVKMVYDVTGAGAVIDKSITIDFNGKTYTANAGVGSAGTQTLALQILKENNVTLKNGTLTSEGENIKMLINNYANLTVDNMKLVDATDAIQYVLSNNSGEVNIINGSEITANGAIALDACKYASYAAPTVNVAEGVTVNGNVEVSATLNMYGTLNGAIVINGAEGVVNGVEGLNVTAMDGYNVAYADGAYTIVEKHYVAQVGEAKYETFAAAVAAAPAGGTVTLIDDATEDAVVILTKNLKIDGAGHTFTGAIEFKKTNGSFTVKNVNFNGPGNSDRVYALKSQSSTTNLTVEGCTATGYPYGFLYANSAIANVTVTDVTVKDVNYGVHSARGTNVTLNNFVAENVKYGVMVQNYSGRNVVLNNCSFTGSENPLYIWERNQTYKITFNFKGANEMGKADFCTGASAMAVVNAEAVAGTKVCGTLAEAVAAAEAGETVTLLRNAEPDNYLTIDKSITLDLGEYNITREGTALYVNGDVEVEINGTTGTVTGKQALYVANGLAKVYGGNFCGLAEAVYVQKTGKAEIYGGTFSSSNFDSFVLNKKDSDREATDITVYGGTFVGFNPANNAAEGQGTNFVAAGLMAVDNGDGTYGIEKANIKMGDSYYATLAEAIAAIGAGDVVIELLADAALDYGAREAYGTAETTSVTILGNGKTLTLNQTNSDWSSFGLAAGKVVLDNMTIEKTGHGDTSGAWNKHAIIFSSPVEMTDVTVNNSVAVQAGATLNNVTINEANGYYGLWINGNGQAVTVNGGSITATNGGRGIKIADQYIDAPAQVTLTVNGTVFSTAKKAAVLVSSKAGAQITADNVDITNVAEDNVNFVWVDEDWAPYFAEVEVEGATKAQEGIENLVAQRSNGASYKTLAAAVEAAAAGETITLIGNTEEDVTVSKNLTIEGDEFDYTGTMTIAAKNVNATVKDVHFVKGNISKSKSYTGGNVTIINCTFDGQGMDTYAVTVARTTDVVVENVTVENYGYGFLYLSHANTNLSVKDVTVKNVNYAINVNYNSNGVTINGLKVVEGVKYAIYNSNYNERTYTITNSDFSGAEYAVKMWERNQTNYDTFKFVGENTLGNAALDANQFAIYEGVVADVAGKKFLDLRAAFAAAQDRETVTLLEDVTLDTKTLTTQDDNYAVLVNVKDKAVTFDLNGNTVTVDAAAADLDKAQGKMLLGVFSADLGGHLTLTDNTDAKAGSVIVNVNDATVYSVFASESNKYSDKSRSGKITVNGGNYTTVGKLANAMFFCDTDEAITINGGNFHCDGATTTSAYPWMVNTLGNNELNVVINGGTFNVDVNHQHRPFEVKIAETSAVNPNGDGTWTVVPAVAYITEMIGSTVNEPGDNARKVGYATLAAAVEAAEADEVVTLLAHVTGAGLVINKDVTIDFNEKTYTFNEGVGSNGTESNGFQILKGNNVTLQNGTLDVAAEVADKFYILVQNYANLTVEDMTLDGTNLDKWSATDGDSYVLSNNSGEVLITGNTDIIANNEGDKAFAFDACDKTAAGYELPKVYVQKTADDDVITITGKIERTGKAAIAISSGIFTTPIADEWCAEYYVPVQNADGTYGVEYRYIDEKTIVDGDYTEFVNEKEMTVGTLTYERDFTDFEGWQSLFVPFEIPVEQLTALGYEVAYFYDVHYETEGEVIDPTKISKVHFIVVKNGTLRANFPYVIKRTSEANPLLSVKLYDAKLYSTAASELNTVESSSTTTSFIFAGTYKKANRIALTGDDNTPCYRFNPKGQVEKMGAKANLVPFRVCMYIKTKDDAPVILDTTNAPEYIQMRVIGESDEETTDIKFYDLDEEQNVDYIYDLQGRRVLEPQKGGLYIVNGKKIVF